MAFFEISIQVNPDFNEILIAELAELGYDSFQEEESQLLAYITPQVYKEKDLKALSDKYSSLFSFKFQQGILEDKNWNKIWEENFKCVELDDRCLVRTQNFKPTKSYQYEIIVNPAMAFGTGHHATTQLMMKELFKIEEWKSKSLLDVGCGSGILAILGKTLGSRYVSAIDLDKKSTDNTKENCELNNVEFLITQATIQELEWSESYNVLVANINKNVLLTDLPYYKKAVKKGGNLLLSGFHESDIKDLEKAAKGFTLNWTSKKEEWVSMNLTRNEE